MTKQTGMVDVEFLKDLFTRGIPLTVITEKEEEASDLWAGFDAQTASGLDYLFALSNIMLDEGENEDALAVLNKIIEVNPRVGFTYGLRANAEFNLGNYKEAIVDCDRAIAIVPHVAYFARRGMARIALKDYRGAIDDFDAAIRIEPTYTWYYFQMGQAVLGCGDAKCAISIFDFVLDKDISDCEIYYQRGLAKIELNDYVGALADLDSSLKLCPETDDVAIKRAEVQALIESH